MHFEEIDDRYKFLVLHGPSRTGKSRLARSLFGYDRTLVVDVLNAEHPNLKSYRRGQHRAILLDEMRDPQFLVDNKKALQSHVDGAELGQSPTQQYVYNVFLWRTPIIITTNNFNLEILAPADRDWVLANCVDICISEPVWASKAVLEPVPQETVSVKRRAADRTPLKTPQRKFSQQSCPACGDRLPCSCR